MSGPLSIGKNDETLRLRYRIEADTVSTGIVDTIDTEQYVMRVLIPADGPDSRAEAYEVPIHNIMTNYGAGFKVMPLSGLTTINVREQFGGKYEHIDYALDEIVTITDSRGGEKQDTTSKLLQRNLEEGDIQVAGTYGSEIYLPVDGSVMLKSQFGSFVKLDNTMSRLDGNFANMQYEMDGVRIRAGNTIRPTKTATTEDQYVLIGEDGTTKGQDEIVEDETYETIKEFSVQVGTIGTSSTSYVDDSTLSPTVGKFSIGERIIDEEGDPLLSAGKYIQCQLRMASGGGFSVTEDGAFYIEDFINYSPVKFDNSETSAERSLRVRKNYVSVSTTDDAAADYTAEITLRHESNSEFILDNGGNIRMQDKTGRYFQIDDYGSALNMTGAMIYCVAKDINLFASDGGSVTLGSGTVTYEVALKGRATAVAFDTHVHAGPSGPPVVLWSGIIDSTLAASGVKLFSG